MSDMFKKVDYDSSESMFADVAEETNEQEVTEEVSTTEEVTEEVVEQEVVQEQEIVEQVVTEKELDESDVIKYFKEKYDKDISNLDSLLSPKESKEIPEEVEKYLEYKEKTGRSYSDFMETQRDWESEDPSYVLKKYLAEKNPYLDAEEVQEEFEDKFTYDVDYDEEKTIKVKKREYKKNLAEALAYFNEQKQNYAVSRFDESVIPQDYKEAKATVEQIRVSQENSAKVQKHFSEETDKFFTNDFKGFDFNVSGNKLNYNVSDVAQVKESQSSIMNFISTFTDESGAAKDIGGYHKAIYGGMNIDKIAEHFYELGKADAIKTDVSTSKNIDMGMKAVGGTNPNATPMFRVLRD